MADKNFSKQVVTVKVMSIRLRRREEYGIRVFPSLKFAYFDMSHFLANVFLVMGLKYILVYV